jgi:hypothetical protein
MSLQKKITLTDKGIKAGPVFAVYYSLNCDAFVFLQNITLTTVNDYAIVTVPDTTLCIKLTALGECSNSVIHTVPGALFGDFSFDFNQLDFN